MLRLRVGRGGLWLLGGLVPGEWWVSDSLWGCSVRLTILRVCSGVSGGLDRLSGFEAVALVGGVEGLSVLIVAVLFEEDL